MDPKGPTSDPAAQGVAEDLLHVWRTLMAGLGPLGKALGLGEKPPFNVVAVRILRIEITESGEKTVAPVRLDDMRPSTSLFMDMKVLLEQKEVTVLSQIYLNEELMPSVMGTDIPEFEITQDDVSDDMLSEEITSKIRDFLPWFSALTTAFLAVLIQTHAKGMETKRVRSPPSLSAQAPCGWP